MYNVYVFTKKLDLVKLAISTRPLKLKCEALDYRCCRLSSAFSANFLVNIFAHKCNRVWTKLVCSSCVPLILCWRAHILVFVEERFNPVYSMIVFSARPYETIQDQWNPHNLQDQWGSHKLQRMWNMRFANLYGRWISLGFHVLKSWETWTKTRNDYI